MSSRGFSLGRSSEVPSSASSGAASSYGPALLTPNAPPNSRPQTPLQRAYPDYVQDHAGFLALNSAIAVLSRLKDVPILPMAISGPWGQAINAVSEMVDAVKLMHENQDDCAHLITRVVNFLQSLADEWVASTAPNLDGTPTAARLIALARYVFRRRRVFSVLKYTCSNLLAIRDDTERWSRMSLLESYLKRDKVKVAISRHGENLTDCINTFQVSACQIIIILTKQGGAEITMQIRTMIRVANFVDRAEARGPPSAQSLSVPLNKEEPMDTSEGTTVRDVYSRAMFSDNSSPFL